MTTATLASAALPRRRLPATRALPALAAPARSHATAPIPALVALLAAVPVALVMVIASSLIGPFIMFAVPFMLLFGFAFGPLHAMVKGEL